MQPTVCRLWYTRALHGRHTIHNKPLARHFGQECNVRFTASAAAHHSCHESYIALLALVMLLSHCKLQCSWYRLLRAKTRWSFKDTLGSASCHATMWSSLHTAVTLFDKIVGIVSLYCSLLLARKTAGSRLPISSLLSQRRLLVAQRTLKMKWLLLPLLLLLLYLGR